MSTDYLNPIMDYNCRTCKSELLKFGAFKKEFPEYKELKMYKVMKEKGKPRIKITELIDPRDYKGIGLQITECICDLCQTNNQFMIMFRTTRDKNKLRIHH